MIESAHEADAMDTHKTPTPKMKLTRDFLLIGVCKRHIFTKGSIKIEKSNTILNPAKKTYTKNLLVQVPGSWGAQPFLIGLQPNRATNRSAV